MKVIDNKRIHQSLAAALVCVSSLLGLSNYAQAQTPNKQPAQVYERTTQVQESLSESRRTRTRATHTSNHVQDLQVKQAERTAQLYAANDIIMPFFPDLVYRPAPSSIIAEKTALFTSDRFYNLGALALVKSQGKWGAIGTKGNELIPPTYKTLVPSDTSNTFLGQNSKKNFVELSATGAILTPEEISAQTKAYEESKNKIESQDTYNQYAPLYSFKENGKYGFKNALGAVVIPPTFKKVFADFSEGIAFVKNEAGEKIAINEQGKKLFIAPGDDIYPYHNGLAEYTRSVGGFNFGSLLGVVFGGGHGFYGGIGGGFTYDGVKRGYINRQGQIVIDGKLDQVWPMTPYGTFVKNKGKLGFVNRDGSYLVQPGNYSAGSLELSRGLFSLKDNKSGLYGVYNAVNGQQVIPFTYKAIDFLGSSRMAAQGDKQIYLIDLTTGKTVGAYPTGTSFQSFGTGQVTWMHDKQGYAIINADGQVLYTNKSHSFSDVTPFTHDYSAVKEKGKWGIIDSHGNWLVKPIYQEITML